MVPRHIAIIMDGNGRWAQAKGLARIKGHQEGIKRIEELIKYAPNKGVKYLTLYAFSTENWQRPKEEVNFLFSIFESYLRSKVKELKEYKIRLKVIGSRENLPPTLISAIEEAEEELSGFDRFFLLIAFNYGGRIEILDAVKKIIAEDISPEDLTEQLFSSFLYTHNIPDPDLLIRTSGEKRISNFLLWQVSYTELYFTDVLWPDFTEQEFDKALAEYQKRRRRFGGL